MKGLNIIETRVTGRLNKGELYLSSNSKKTAASSTPHVDQQPIVSTPAAVMRVEDAWASLTVTKDSTQQQAEEVFQK